MRIIFRLLNRRWLLVTGWVYVFSLTLAALMYWMLPATSLMHRWTFSGSNNVDGFSSTDRKSIIVSPFANPDKRFRLDTMTGAINQCSEVSNQLLPPAELPYELSYSSAFHHRPRVSLILKNKRDSTERSISCHEESENHIEVDYIYASHGFVGYATILMTTSGMVAMSKDERWLLLLGCQPNGWVSLKNWLTERTAWSPSFLPNDFKHTAFVVDLQTNQVAPCDLSTTACPEFVIHPDNSGFVVVEMERDLMGSPELFSNQTIITWYTLPPGPACHTRNQWFIIIGTLFAPILVVMLSHLIRRRKPQHIQSFTS